MNWVAFFGRFHPLLVHLPIGILLLACALDWLSFGEKYKRLKESVALSLLLGTIAAFVSCVSGYLLSLSGEYEESTVQFHQWLGIITTVLSFSFWQMKKQGSNEKTSKIFSIVTVISVSATGHLGGTLTHGEKYLTESLTEENAEIDFSSLDVNTANYYPDIVQPILKAHCYSCHGDLKQKGKLRLDQPDFILKGGKSGKTVVVSHPDESEIINRMLLPIDEKKHMPPKEKPQPSPQEIELLKEWISLGANFTISVKALHAEEAVRRILSVKNSIHEELNENVDPADVNVIDKLKKFNVTIVPLAFDNHFLSANFQNANSIDSAIALLPSLKNQLVWLTASLPSISDKHLETIGKLSALRKLDLRHSSLSGSDLTLLADLVNLKSLNLSFTLVKAQQLNALAKLPELKELFLFNTLIKEHEIAELKKKFPVTHLEFGNYEVPTFASDTTVIKPPKN
jgi:uncharacterized membrane protein